MYTVRGFLKAAVNGDAEAVARYLAREGYARSRNGDGDTALHMAAQGGHDEVIRQLVKAGLALEEKNKQGYTPLGIAVLHNEPRALEALLASGADVNADQRGGASPVSVALNQYNSPCVKILLAAKADPNKGNPLCRALDNRNYELAQTLVEAGADPETPGSNNYRPIHYAAMHGAEKFMALLLEKGVDINATGYGGDTPLHNAVNQGQTKMVEMLLQKGARIDIENNYGKNAYQAAQQKGQSSILLLIEPLVKEEISKNTTPLTANAEAMPAGDAEVWLRMGAHQVARVGVYPALNRRLTEIFNFESRERLIISENLKTGAENITPPASFDTLAEATLKKALGMFREHGGQADEETVFGVQMPKKTLKPG